MSGTSDQQAADDAEERRRLEAGRLFFAGPWRFLSGAPHLGALPAAEGLEIAFAGRSNVGKSSLINALTGQQGLARTSNTPGRTQDLNYFAGPPGLSLVDMPGYGFAQAPKERVAAWTELVFAYLRGRPNLRRVYLLIDARHGVKVNDRAVLELLDRAAVSYQVVLTKADKPGAAALAAVTEATQAAIARRPAAHPELIVTSSAAGSGFERLRAEIAALV